ncbi:sigma 54-interacting transcriptional regulator [Clostridium thermobutyricum]|uniref:Propionate catabolism operon regulatory protein n=1 Tax=Clostridium thermobutyricum DSM 4928 TaxID=1121339 RepID=A0A1V4SW46_9CLOT|nr:sigma 54-interacting transcriptional regulator [Clostridium thermobutyricum]OPX47529.1 propionate catabolism operon regulatory protein [Clostridium thermobutyricum DSM 4928]
MEVLNNEKINISIVSPYSEMSDYFNNLKDKRININAKTINDKQEIKEFIKENETTTDVFLSGGSSVSFIRENTNIPVVDIKITNFDLIKAINSIEINDNTQIVCLSYYKDVFDLEEIKSIFKLKKNILQIKYIIPEDIKDSLKKAKELGGNLVVGGGCTEIYSKNLSLKSILLKSSDEAMNKAIEDAINIFNVRKKEIEKNVKLNTILNFIKQGIIVTDTNNKITICNTEAAKILNVNKEEILDKNITNILGISENSTELSSDGIININGKMVATSTIEIKINDTLIGRVNSFDKASTIQKLERKIRNNNHKKGLVAKYNFDNIITKDKNMEKIKKMAMKYAKTNATILIYGESGTGKELFAQSIHNQSDRRDWPFVAVNCGAINENLLESELFGYDKGAFTGAKKEGKVGLFELAHRGTIFLDEIGELPLGLQSSLLRVIQEKEIMRVGSNEITPIDIRIVCATNKDLRQEVLKGRFREDLYYRLNVFNISVPALRDRRADIPLISKELLNRFGVFNKEEVIEIIKKCPSNYAWRGNIRELENVIRRLSLMVEFSDFDMDNIDYKSFIDGMGNYEKEYSLKINMNNSLKEIIKEVEFKIINKLLEDGYKMEDILDKLEISRASYMRKKSQMRYQKSHN